MIGPILKNKRIVLKSKKVSEAGQYLTWLKDPLVGKYLSADYTKLTLKKEKEYLRKIRKDKNNLTWSIYTKKGIHIGTVGFDKLDLKQSKKALLGIVIGNKDYWGQGYCQEAIKTVLAFGFNKLKLNRVELSVFIGNAGALKCYIKSGFKKEGLKKKSVFRNGKYLDEIIMGILKSDYKKFKN